MWTEPKTDWTEDDYFNIEDYNRIIGNLAELRELAVTVYKSFDLEDMGNDKRYQDYIYADEINTIERNLASLCNNTYHLDAGSQKTYYQNQPTIDWKEFNRIESACLNLYQNLQGQVSGKRRLSFVLGGDGFEN